MAKIQVRFLYVTGMKKTIIQRLRLLGSWDPDGIFTGIWTEKPMREMVGADGCPQFEAIVEFDESQVGVEFRWGVSMDGLAAQRTWGLPTEIRHPVDQERYRSFVLAKPADREIATEEYYLTHNRRLGANKRFLKPGAAPGIQFAVWAPNAKAVEVVFGREERGYIADNGVGIDRKIKPIALRRLPDGVWQTEILPDFQRFLHKSYMFRITRKDGRVTFRTDLYSRCQVGSGAYDPNGKAYKGKHEDLDGTRSCSVVMDPEFVTRTLAEPLELQTEFQSDESFWNDEIRPEKPLPSNIQELVMYELHVGALGYGREGAGNLQDAIGLLDYLAELGVNAVELLPIAEYEGSAAWGYGTSHFFAIEFSAGGRDQFKHFVRECHRRGMVVILDVVYNHYHHSSERAEWCYDSGANEENIYYWYEGRAADYPGYEAAAAEYPERVSAGHGGYVDNLSTGYAPRYHEEMVRKMLISSAATFVEEFHVDGFRLDQTTSIHLYNVLHADGRSAGVVNAFGAKFLREFSRTIKMIKPDSFLMAEDHSGWDKVTESPDAGGLGFDAVWFSGFFHHLVGNPGKGADWGKLLTQAGLDDSCGLAMDAFAGALADSGRSRIVYHSSHDEVGNAEHSARPIVLAVNHAPLVGETRKYAEARTRFACGMAMLSAGTPMFFMGEEVGAAKAYCYNTFVTQKEDLLGERKGNGRQLFAFYQDLIALRRQNPALCSRLIEVLHVHNANRVLFFRRWNEDGEFVIAASLNNRAFGDGYGINHPSVADRRWQEVFSSDHTSYGGNGRQNHREIICSEGTWLNVVIPANGFVVLRRVNE